MEYVITDIKDCRFVFNHTPAVGRGHFGAGSPEKYKGEIELELIMYEGMRVTSSRKVNKTLISFLYSVPANVVVEETKEKVSIHVPIDFYAGFYEKLCEGIDDKKYRIYLETAGKDTMTLARFKFVPR